MDNEVNLIHNDWLGLLNNEEECNDDSISNNKTVIRKCYHCYCELLSFFTVKHVKCNVCCNLFCKKCAAKDIEVFVNDKQRYKVCDCCYENYISFNISMNKYAVMLANGSVHMKIKYHNDNNNESHIVNAINDVYERKLKEMIHDTFNKKINGENNMNEWKDELYNTMKDIMYNMKPLYVYLNEGMDINDYIKITTMNNDNKCKCKAVNGVVMKLNTFNEVYYDKANKTNNDIEIAHPKILIVNACALDEHYRQQYISLDVNAEISESEQSELNEHYVALLVNKIKLIDIDVILIANEVNSSISAKFIQEVTNVNKKVYVITNVKGNVLDKVAKSVQTVILPSIDFVSKRTLIGKCGLFTMKSVNDVTYVSFEKCETFLIGSICLYENNINTAKSKQILKKIKNLIKYNILPLSRDFYLQSKYFYYINALPQSITFNTLLNINDEFKLHTNTIYIPYYKTINTNCNSTSLPLVSQDNTKETNKLFPNKCYYSNEQTMTLYSTNDESLGSFILTLSKGVLSKCKVCTNVQGLHWYNYYNERNGKLTIKMILDLNDNDLYIVLNYLFKQTKINFWNETHALTSCILNNENENINETTNSSTHNINEQIYTYGYCKICKCIVTPLFTSTFYALNFSKNKFIHNFLYHHSAQNNSTRTSFNISPFIFETSAIPSKPCSHFINKNINQIFITKHSSFVFEYSSFPKHIPFHLQSQSQSHSLLSPLNTSLYQQKTILHICTNISKILSSYLTNKTAIVQNKITSFPFEASSIKYPVKLYQHLKHKIIELLSMLLNLLNKYRRDIINCILSMQFDSIPQMILFIQKSILMLIQLKLSSNYIDVIIHELICFIYDESEWNDDFNGDNTESYVPLLTYLQYYNNEDHSLYSTHVDVNDIASIITQALTSDEYIHYIKEHKRCFNLIDINTVKQHHSLNQMNLTFNPNEFQYETFTNKKICILLENEITSFQNEIFTYEFNNKFPEHVTLFTKENDIYSNTPNNIFSKVNKEIISINDIIESIQNEFYALKTSIITLNNYSHSTNVSKYKQYTHSLYEQINIFKNEVNNYTLSYKVEIYFPRQFETFRIVYCSTYKEIINSLHSSKEWSDVSGGKSKAEFLLSNDKKYIFKLVQENEFEMFLQSANSYFEYISKYLFRKAPSVLAKILGVFKVCQSNGKIYYVVLMENLLYGIDDVEYKVYDLKGAEINRYVSNKERGKVFLDMNYKEDFNAEPISIDKTLYNEIMEALRNDCLVLNKMNVVDYSLMLIIGDDSSNNNNKYIKIGIIDYLRKYTWDKKIEEYSKKIANGFVRPTIINPDSYRKRFINEMQKHFIGI